MTPKGTLPVPLDMVLRTRAKALYEAGATFADIESETGVKSASLRSWKRRDGWTRASESAELVVAESAEIEIPESLPEQAAQYEDDMRRAALTFSRYVSELPGETITAKSQHIKNGDQTARKALRIEGEKPSAVIQIGILAQGPPKQDQLRIEERKPLHSYARPRRISE